MDTQRAKGIQRSEYSESDLENAECVEQILRHGSDEDIRMLSEHYQLTPEQVDLLRFDERERELIHKQSVLDIEQRQLQNPQPTEDELAMGTFIEGIEYQVRSAVIELRKKGYSTWESGYVGGAAQRISYEAVDLSNFSMPNELIDELKQKGIMLHLGNEEIELRSSIPVSATDWKYIWDKVVDNMPNLKTMAIPSKLIAAQYFRERYG